MSEPQDNVDIGALKDTFLECPVCVEHFNQTDRRPRLLHSCLHAFCTQCLQQLLAKEGKGQITCPLCRQVHKIPGNPDTLPVDPVRAKLVDFVQIKKEGKAPCTDCPEGSTAESRCQECSVYLCKECAYVHRRHRLTHDHPVISLSGVLEQPLNTFAKGHFCTHHPKHQLEFYCASDETLCCLSCTVVEHKGHDFQKLDEAAERRQRELEASMRAVNTNAQQLRQRRLSEERRQTAIAQAQVKAKSDVNAHFAKLTNILNERESHLVGDIDERSSRMLSLSEKEVEAIDQTLAVTESTETYFTQAKEKADVVEILQMYPAIKRSLDAAADGPGQGGLTAPEIVVTFIPTNGNVVEKLGSEVGCVSESTDTQNENDQLLQCLDEVFDAALKYKTKKKLIDHFEKKSYSNERETCAICENYIVDAKGIWCGHRFCKICIDQVLSKQTNCPVCNTNGVHVNYYEECCEEYDGQHQNDYCEEYDGQHQNDYCEEYDGQ
ncbi:E3 ubiquitin-protein ligase TRIM56-like isoform X2 [Haliotis asinina]|uniref:E3 ubiquitin-protein ligase TRIM56-like isoform X2 n=1 Tax=Haliotis asinina TaxID=109174 RepID=UPI003531D503